MRKRNYLSKVEYARRVASGEIRRGISKTPEFIVRYGRFGGAPPPGDPRKCQAKKGCKDWARPGSRFCRRHAGALMPRRPLVDLRGLPMFYSKRLNKTLANAVEEQLGLHPDEQCALYEELALTRVLAGDSLQLWDAARALPEANPKRAEILTTAEAVVRQALGEVRSMCEAAARVRASSNGRVSVHNLQFVVAQLVRISHRVFGEDEEGLRMAHEFERLVREEMKVMADDQPGTSILPGGDAEVRALDDTVPAVGTPG